MWIVSPLDSQGLFLCNSSSSVTVMESCGDEGLHNRSRSWWPGRRVSLLLLYIGCTGVHQNKSTYWTPAMIWHKSWSDKYRIPRAVTSLHKYSQVYNRYICRKAIPAIEAVGLNVGCLPAPWINYATGDKVREWLQPTSKEILLFTICIGDTV